MRIKIKNPKNSKQAAKVFELNEFKWQQMENHERYEIIDDTPIEVVQQLRVQVLNKKISNPATDEIK